MPDVGIKRGLAYVVITERMRDKLAVISEALHIPSINHVMDHALLYEAAGWTLLHCARNTY